jgi:hypothetical protein
VGIDCYEIFSIKIRGSGLSRSSDDDDDAGAPPYDEIDEIPTLLFSNSHEEHLDFDLILLCFWCFVNTQENL